MPKVTQAATRKARDERERRSLCIETSVDLAHPDKWRSTTRGEYAVVRLNFVADISHVKRPRAYYRDDIAANLDANAKRTRSPLAQVDVLETARGLITGDVTDQLHQAVRAAYQKNSGDIYADLRSALKSVVVANACRPSPAGRSIPVVRRGGRDKVRVRDDRTDPVILLGARDVTLYLAYVDYMLVTYKRKRLGRNLVRIKTPAYQGQFTLRRNEIVMDGFPFASFRVLEVESVGTPSDRLRPASAADLDNANVMDAPPPDRTVTTDDCSAATLYNVSSAAFPMRREMALRHDWTEEDLAELPLESDNLEIAVKTLKKDKA